MIITVKAPAPEHLGREVIGYNREGQSATGVLNFDQRDGFYIEEDDRMLFDVSAVIECTQLQSAAERFHALGFPCLTFQSLT